MNHNIQAKIEEALKPFTKASKAWQGNLSKYLDDFMKCIAELSTDDDEGLRTANFIQAGMMLENTSRIYAANVDILWQCMIAVLEHMQMNKKKSSNSTESTEGESSQSKEEVVRKRRKKVVCDNFEEFVPRVIDPDMKGDEKNQVIKPLPYSRCMLGKYDWKRRKRPYKVLDMENDPLDTSEFSVMYQTSTFGKLQHNMLKEAIVDSLNGEHSMSELIYTLEHLCLELSLLVVDSCSEYSSCSHDERCVTPPIEIIEISPPRETVFVTPPPSPLTLKRSNSASIEGPSPIKRSMSDADSEKEVRVGERVTENLRSREHVATITTDPWTPDHLENEKSLEKRPPVSLTPNIKPLKPEEKKHRPPRCKMVIQYVGLDMFYISYKTRAAACTAFRRFFIQKRSGKKIVVKEHSRISLSVRPDFSKLHKCLSQDVTQDFLGYEDFEADPGEEDGFCGFPTREEQNSRLQPHSCFDSVNSENVGSSEISCTCNNVGTNENSCICSSRNSSVGTNEKTCTCGSNIGTSENTNNNSAVGNEKSCSCSTATTEKSCTCVDKVRNDSVVGSEKSCTCNSNVGTTENSCTCVNMGNDKVGTSEHSCTCAESVRNRSIEKCCTCGNKIRNENGSNTEMPSCRNNDNNDSGYCHDSETGVSASHDVPPCTSSEEPNCSSNIPGESEMCRGGISAEPAFLQLEESCQQMMKRVAEWERYIRPKLKQARERRHFDIHAVGSQILESFPVSSPGAVLDFHQIMADKPKVDIARFFLATLALANSNNVEILQSDPGDLSMDCMQLKLISSVLHHESLKDYEAPSEGARKKRKKWNARADLSDSDNGTDSDSETRCKSKRKRNKR